NWDGFRNIVPDPSLLVLPPLTGRGPRVTNSRPATVIPSSHTRGATRGTLSISHGLSPAGLRHLLRRGRHRDRHRHTGCHPGHLRRGRFLPAQIEIRKQATHTKIPYDRGRGWGTRWRNIIP